MRCGVQSSQVTGAAMLEFGPIRLDYPNLLIYCHWILGLVPCSSIEQAHLFGKKDEEDLSIVMSHETELKAYFIFLQEYVTVMYCA